jgi:hypothetical protein
MTYHASPDVKLINPVLKSDNGALPHGPPTTLPLAVMKNSQDIAKTVGNNSIENATNCNRHEGLDSSLSRLKANDMSQHLNVETSHDGQGSHQFTPFPFHNPFDMNSYPITNPPIFDSTMNLPYDSSDHVNRRRRISISNGQIGQIINHEAIFDYENFPGDTFVLSHQMPRQNTTEQNVSLDNIVVLEFSQGSGGQNAMFQQQFQPGPVIQPATTIDEIPLSSLSLISPPTSLSQQQITPSPNDEKPVNSPPAEARAPTVVAGVPPPNHQLIYNDEIIFNPNNGPIPGTAAWKKERLLERNRVAASKCRQRKKKAQMKLQDDVNKIEGELKEQKDVIEKLSRALSFYNLQLKTYFDKNDPESLEKLREFVDLGIQDLLNKEI